MKLLEVVLKINQFNDKCYYIKGTYILHREDGPAVEFADGTKWWFINGLRINCLSQETFEISKEYRSWKLKIFT